MQQEQQVRPVPVVQQRGGEDAGPALQRLRERRVAELQRLQHQQQRLAHAALAALENFCYQLIYLQR